MQVQLVLIDDFNQSVRQLEELLQKITSDMTTGIVFERLQPSELWGRSEIDVTSLRSLAEHLREFMLTLKPERVPTIKKRTLILSANNHAFSTIYLFTLAMCFLPFFFESIIGVLPTL